MGDSAATFLLIKEAIRFGRLRSPNLIDPQRHLRTLADGGNLTAMYLAGQVYESEGDFSQALKVYKMATTSLGDAPNGENASDNSLGDTWKAISRLKANAGDCVGAEEAIRTSALQYDDPFAYYMLAKAYIPPSSEDYETYMLKAAASGEPKAAHELGILYYKQSQGSVLSTPDRMLNGHANSPTEPGCQDVSKSHTATLVIPKMASEKGTQAREWFAIGAESDVAISQLYLAVLLRAAGKHVEGLAWLERASSSKQWLTTISWLRGMWNQKDPIEIDTAWDGKYNFGKTEVKAHGVRMVITE